MSENSNADGCNLLYTHLRLTKELSRRKEEVDSTKQLTNRGVEGEEKWVKFLKIFFGEQDVAEGGSGFVSAYLSVAFATGGAVLEIGTAQDAVFPEAALDGQFGALHAFFAFGCALLFGLFAFDGFGVVEYGELSCGRMCVGEWYNVGGGDVDAPDEQNGVDDGVEECHYGVADGASRGGVFLQGGAAVGR